MDNYFYSSYGVPGSRNLKSELSKEFATQNGLDYMEDVIDGTIANPDIPGFKFFAKDNRYILFNPINEGRFISSIYWYGEFNNRATLIMDNHDSVKNIKNLKDILLQMIYLYEKYLDEDMVIMPEGFAVKLTDSIGDNYRGKANLVITGSSNMNDFVRKEKMHDAKTYCISKFLNYYIGLNFGVAIKNNSDLEDALIHLNDEVIRRRLKRNLSSDRWISNEDVRPYKYKKQHM